MKKLFAVSAVAAGLVLWLFSAGCASQGPSYGAGGGDYFAEDRYYDCLDGYDCGYTQYPDGTSAGLLARETVARSGIHRPAPRVIQRPSIADSPAAREVRARLGIPRPSSGVSSAFFSNAPGSSVSAGSSSDGGGVARAPVVLPSGPASFSPATPSRPEPIPSTSKQY
jgi:hypothetical protein